VSGVNFKKEKEDNFLFLARVVEVLSATVAM
jgi:hypothetical protein